MANDTLDATSIADRLTAMENLLRSLPTHPRQFLQEHSPTLATPSGALKTMPTATTLDPGPQLLDALPSLDRPFHTTLLPDEERRRLLMDCPRNLRMAYEGPSMANVPLPPQARSVDSALADIQYRLSGITRPLDLFAFNVVNQGSEPIDNQSITRFLDTVRTLLADVSSSISQQRTALACRSLNVSVPATDLAGRPQVQLLPDDALVAAFKHRNEMAAFTRKSSNNGTNNNNNRRRRHGCREKQSTSASSTISSQRADQGAGRVEIPSGAAQSSPSSTLRQQVFRPRGGRPNQQ